MLKYETLEKLNGSSNIFFSVQTSTIPALRDVGHKKISHFSFRVSTTNDGKNCCTNLRSKTSFWCISLICEVWCSLIFWRIFFLDNFEENAGKAGRAAVYGANQK